MRAFSFLLLVINKIGSMPMLLRLSCPKDKQYLRQKDEEEINNL